MDHTLNKTWCKTEAGAWCMEHQLYVNSEVNSDIANALMLTKNKSLVLKSLTVFDEYTKLVSNVMYL